MEPRDATVRAFFAAMNAQDADAACALAREDVQMAFGPHELAGHEALRRLALQTDERLTFETVPEEVTADGDTVTVAAKRISRWRESGEPAGEDAMSARFTLDGEGAIARVELGS